MGILLTGAKERSIDLLAGTLQANHTSDSFTASDDPFIG